MSALITFIKAHATCVRDIFMYGNAACVCVFVYDCAWSKVGRKKTERRERRKQKKIKEEKRELLRRGRLSKREKKPLK